MTAADVSSAGVLPTPPAGASAEVDGRLHGLSWYWQAAVLLVAAGLVCSRQPDALLHAQFYGEDGHVWFADAYNRGWFAALFRIQDGYFQTLPRVAAALALLAPLQLAPLVMNLAGLLIQLLPVPILLSSRLRRWGSLSFRAVLALAYLALPNSRELNLTVTESQWHLALAASLLLLSDPPRNRPGRAFDLCVFGLCGVTGPFCILLLPMALVFWWIRKHSWTLVGAVIFVITAGVQIYALLQGGAARVSALPLGAGMEQFLRILGGQVYTAAILGSNSLASFGGTLPMVLIAIAGTAMMLYACRRAAREFQLLTCLAMLLFLASLKSPMIGPPGSAKTAWEFLAGRPGIHYWFFPTLVVSWGVMTLIWGPRRTQVSQMAGLFLGLAMVIGMAHDWNYASFPDGDFAAYAQQVRASRPGETIVIPETPPGWTLRLTKR